MSSRQIVSALFFAVLWTAFMVWWNGEYNIAKIAMLAVVGLIIGFVWAWAMKRFGYWT